MQNVSSTSVMMMAIVFFVVISPNNKLNKWIPCTIIIIISFLCQTYNHTGMLRPVRRLPVFFFCVCCWLLLCCCCRRLVCRRCVIIMHCFHSLFSFLYLAHPALCTCLCYFPVQAAPPSLPPLAVNELILATVIMDFSAFSNPTFDSVKWIDSMIAERPEEEQLDTYITSLTMKLHVVSQEYTDQLETGTLPFFFCTALHQYASIWHTGLAFASIQSTTHHIIHTFFSIHQAWLMRHL